MNYEPIRFANVPPWDERPGLPPERSESQAEARILKLPTSVRYVAHEGLESLTEPRTLLIDIENRPNLAYVWDVWNQNIGPHLLLESKEILSFAYKWLGQEGIHCWSQFFDGKKEMLEALWKVMDKADIVIDYNGTKHDILHINHDLLLAGYGPPSPYQHIDLYKTVKRKFKFTYNSLKHVCEQLGLSAKLDDGGFSTWLGCMKDDPEAWAKLVEYNMGDIPPLEELYLKLRPWISAHPNMSLYAGERRCPHCNSKNTQLRGWRHTPAGKYRRVYCNDCKAWSRLAKRESTTDIRTAAD